MTAQFDYREAFKRNIGLVTEAEQNVLRNATIAIPGMGGVGGIHLATLLRMGVGGFHIADADTFELANFNRQYGATMQSAGKDKVEVMNEVARSINPEVRLKSWNRFIDAETVDEFLDGVDLLIDSVDAFAFEARHILFMAAYRKNIPVVSCGPIGCGVTMLVFLPGAVSFDEYFGYESGLSQNEEFVRFIVGLCPRPYFLRYLDTSKLSLTERAGPSLASSVALCAGFAATEALKLLLGRGRVRALPYVHYFDTYLHRFVTVRQCRPGWKLARSLKWRSVRKLLSARR